MLEFLNPVFIYSQLREKVYTSGIKKRLKLDVPVVSVGNLQFGGSGKTPFVMYLLKRYQKYQIAVVSQSYKAQLSRPERVDLERGEFQKIYGDEPSLIKKTFPQVDVWCGPVKWKTALAATEFKKYDLIILDDGFSHHRLFRDLDLLLMDGSRPLNSYTLPPQGLLRESLSAVARADAVVITKVNQLNEADSLIEKVKNYTQRVGWARYLSQLHGEKAHTYFLFAGIGNFDFFHQNAKALGISIRSFEKYENHFGYSEEKQQQILEHLKKSNMRGLTTLKDLIKITNKELLALTDHLQVEIELDTKTEQWLDESILAKISARPR